MHAATIAFLVVVAGPVPVPARAAAVVVGPDHDWCAQINALPAGGQAVLKPGDYRGPCVIRRSGTSEAPIVVRAQDIRDKARIVYSGATSNVLEIKASHVHLRGLAFGPSQPTVDGVRIYGGVDVRVEECDFSGLGGIAVVANHRPVSGLVVRGNRIEGSRATAMYFGCHDGKTCAVDELVVEQNQIRTVHAPDPEIGYGIQLKLNTTGLIRDNVIVDTKGPGIMVYGGVGDRPSEIERNIVIGAQRAPGIVVGGGPAVVRNNFVLAGLGGGIGLENYGHRDLLRGIVVAHNTLYGNRWGLRWPRQGVRSALVINNAIEGGDGVRVPAPSPGVTLGGNVECAVAACFVNPAGWDFSPRPGGAAEGAGIAGGRPSIVSEDFFGVGRAPAPTAGAVEPPGRPLIIPRLPGR